jgi:hypothetical protein
MFVSMSFLLRLKYFFIDTRCYCWMLNYVVLLCHYLLMIQLIYSILEHHLDNNAKEVLYWKNFWQYDVHEHRCERMNELSWSYFRLCRICLSSLLILELRRNSFRCQFCCCPLKSSNKCTIWHWDRFCWASSSSVERIDSLANHRASMAIWALNFSAYVSILPRQIVFWKPTRF